MFWFEHEFLLVLARSTYYTHSTYYPCTTVQKCTVVHHDYEDDEDDENDNDHDIATKTDENGIGSAKKWIKMRY